jgi:hypothetical protein
MAAGGRWYCTRQSGSANVHPRVAEIHAEHLLRRRDGGARVDAGAEGNDLVFLAEVRDGVAFNVRMSTRGAAAAATFATPSAAARTVADTVSPTFVIIERAKPPTSASATRARTTPTTRRTVRACSVSRAEEEAEESVSDGESRVGRFMGSGNSFEPDTDGGTGRVKGRFSGPRRTSGPRRGW